MFILYFQRATFGDTSDLNAENSAGNRCDKVDQKGRGINYYIILSPIMGRLCVALARLVTPRAKRNESGELNEFLVFFFFFKAHLAGE